LRNAVFGVARSGLIKPGRFGISIAVHGGEARPAAASPRRWSGPAHEWVSATPVVHERWTRGQPGIGEVTRWCEHAAFPAPVEVELSRRPLLRGALDLSPSLVFRQGREHYPYSHLRVRFGEPVKGPLVLGRGRHYGLGLMSPVREEMEGADRDA
jgi:CRISPR-associated protein Csb2